MSHSLDQTIPNHCNVILILLYILVIRIAQIIWISLLWIRSKHLKYALFNFYQKVKMCSMIFENWTRMNIDSSLLFEKQNKSLIYGKTMAWVVLVHSPNQEISLISFDKYNLSQTPGDWRRTVVKFVPQTFWPWWITSQKKLASQKKAVEWLLPNTLSDQSRCRRWFTILRW